jgi:hypothetical protein
MEPHLSFRAARSLPARVDFVFVDKPWAVGFQLVWSPEIWTCDVCNRVEEVLIVCTILLLRVQRTYRRERILSACLVLPFETSRAWQISC